MREELQDERGPVAGKGPDGLSVGSFVGMGILVIVVLVLVVSILALYTSPRNSFRTRWSRYLKHGSRDSFTQETALESAIRIPRPPPTYSIAPGSTAVEDRASRHQPSDSCVGDGLVIPLPLPVRGSLSSQVYSRIAPTSSSQSDVTGHWERMEGTHRDFPPQTSHAKIASESSKTLPSVRTSWDVKAKHIRQRQREGSPTSEPEPSSEESTSSGSLSVSDSSTLGSPLEICKQRAVDSLMTEFKSLLSHGPHLGLKVRAGGGERRTGGRGRSSNSSSGGSMTARKRGLGKRDNIDHEDSAKRPKLEDLPSPGLRFACPFYKRNSKKHLRHRACAGPGWGEVRRVKEHLYRTHAIPIHCHRCGTIFKSEADLRNHQRQPEGCEIKLLDLPEGFDKTQEAELRKKKHGETEEERWYAMYRILFPDEDGDLVPSPYYLNSGSPDAEDQRVDEIRQYERFQRRELLRVVRRLLQDAVSGMAGPLEDQMRTQFVGIIRQAQSEVFRAYRGSLSHGSATSQDAAGCTQVTSGSTPNSPNPSRAASPAVQREGQASTATRSSPHAIDGYYGDDNNSLQFTKHNDFSTKVVVDYGKLYVEHAGLQSILEPVNPFLWTAGSDFNSPQDSRLPYLPPACDMSRLTMDCIGPDSISDIDIGVGSASSHCDLMEGQSMWGSQDTSESSIMSTDFGLGVDGHLDRNGRGPSSPSGDESWLPPHFGSFIRLDY